MSASTRTPRMWTDATWRPDPHRVLSGRQDPEGFTIDSITASVACALIPGEPLDILLSPLRQRPAQLRVGTEPHDGVGDRVDIGGIDQQCCVPCHFRERRCIARDHRHTTRSCFKYGQTESLVE